MNSSYIFLASVLISLPCISLSGKEVQEQCLDEVRGTRRWNADVIIRSNRNDEGHWISDFNTFHETDESTENLYIGLKQRIIVCGEKEVLHIRGTIGGDESKSEKNKLRFSPKSGKNAVLSNNGIKVSRKNSESECCYSGVITSRTLLPDELFEVKLEKMTKKKYSWSINVGITTADPKDTEFPEQVMHITSRTWLYVRNAVYFNGTLLKDNYGKNLHGLRDGDSVGVMRKSNGDIHFYVNRVDQGIAVKDTPYYVYGTVDVKSNTAQVSIVDS